MKLDNLKQNLKSKTNIQQFWRKLNLKVGLYGTGTRVEWVGCFSCMRLNWV